MLVRALNPDPPAMEKPAPLLRCEVVGQTVVSIGEKQLAAEGELVLALALFLGLNAGEEVPRDFVAHMFWPAYDAESARHSLRQLVYRVRALGVAVSAHGDSIELARGAVSLDYTDLLAMQPSRDVYLRYGRFDVLPDYAPPISPLFARWVEEFRERLGIRLRSGLVACIADARSRGRYREVSQLARHCLALDPLNEEATLGLAEATALEGNKVRALEMLAAYQVDLGASPALQLQTDLLRRRIAERLNVYSTQPHDVPMIGREDAMECLLRGVHELSSGSARAVLVTGEAGIGKTRLLTEFARVTAMHSVRTVVLRCHPGWPEQPLTAITDLVTTLLQLPGALGCSPDAMAALRDLTSALPRRSDAGMYAGDAEAMLANLRWSVVDLFEAVMQEKNLVLLIDNVQWLDELSEHFLDHVLRRCAKRPLYVVMTSREGAEGAGGGREVVRPLLATEHRVALRPLDDDMARALVRQVVELTDRVLPEVSVGNCVRRCGGNPYFLSEMVRFYLISGPDAEPPVTLRMFLENRLRRVSKSARRALEVVAILGAFSTLRRIQRVTGLRAFASLEALEVLHREGLVDFRDDKCLVRHDVIGELVGSELSPLARRVLHLRAAKVFFEDTRSSQDPILLGECGQHLLDSGDHLRAPRGAHILARRLLQLGAAEKAAELAVAAERRIDGESARLECRVTAARALRALGRWEHVRTLCVDVGNAQATSGDRRALTDLAIMLAEADLSAGGLRPDLLEFVTGIAESNEVEWPQRLRASRVAVTAADHRWDRELANRVAEVLGRAPSVAGELGAMLITSQMILSTVQCDWDATQAHAARLIDHARSIRSRSLRSQSVRFAANGLLRCGDISGARALLRESCALSTGIDHWWHILNHHLLGFVIELQDGEIAAANASLAAAREVSTKLPASRRLQLDMLVMTDELAVESGAKPTMPWIDHRKLRDEIRSADPRLWQTLLGVLLLHPRTISRRNVHRSLQAELRDTLHSMANAGWQDFAVYALGTSYVASGAEDVARAEVRLYLERNRGERAKLRPQLGMLTTQLGIVPDQAVTLRWPSGTMRTVLSTTRRSGEQTRVRATQHCYETSASRRGAESRGAKDS